jgi:DNA repair protein RadD
MKLRPYQQTSIDKLYDWWMKHPETGNNPLVVLPTGSGKSVVIAELVRLLFDTWPDQHPRTVVLVPSKELAEQNAEKLRALLPTHIGVGYYSASLGRKQGAADVIVATVGSIYKDAHLLGNIRCVVIDEAHLVNTSGAEAGRYRQFLTALAKYCRFRVVGYTATPFRGDGTWLTEGDAPLFTGVAHTTTMRQLLENDPPYLSALVRPVDVIKTQIDTTGIKTTGGDYNIGELSDKVDQYLEDAAREAVALASDRKKWIAFCATVANAKHLREILCSMNVTAEVVTGDTEKRERELLIKQFKAGHIQCLITVMALATGFDVPDVDCLIWLRPTKSPVLYVQGFGRGTRIAPGKADCLVLDFTDTVERLGPVDSIKGRIKRAKKEDAKAPHRVCPECGETAPIAATDCPSCGYEYPPPEEKESRSASNAAILSSQIHRKIETYSVDRVTYALHSKPGKPDSVRVDYWHGMRVVCSEWVCLEHGGFAGEKARLWWHRRVYHSTVVPSKASEAVSILQNHQHHKPPGITVNETGKYPELIGYQWNLSTEGIAA